MKQVEIDEIVSVAKDCLLRNKAHAPQALLMTENGLMVIMLDFGSEKAKEGSAEALREMVSMSKADRYFFISEGWMKKIEPDDVIQARASLYKDRKECLVIMEFNRDMTAKQAMIQFSRKDDEIIIEQEDIYREIPHQALASRFNVYLEREGVKEEIAMQVKKQRQRAMKLLADNFAEKYEKLFFDAKTKVEREAIIEKMIGEMVAEKKRQKDMIFKEGEKHEN